MNINKKKQQNDEEAGEIVSKREDDTECMMLRLLAWIAHLCVFFLSLFLFLLLTLQWAAIMGTNWVFAYRFSTFSVASTYFVVRTRGGVKWEEEQRMAAEKKSFVDAR